MSVKHLEVLVEEESMAVALESLLPKIIGDTSFRIYSYQGKRDLLAKLSVRLKGYAAWLHQYPDWRILVVVDRDNDDCHELKQRLELQARTSGLITRQQRVQVGGQYQVINRIAIEELEAWYFGDWEAMIACYEKLPTTVPRNANYRNPDAIHGGTWEKLEQVFNRAGYYRSGLPKIELARTVGPLLDPARNKSKSFQVFRDALLEMVQE